MFFPCLENLKQEKFHEKSIELLDWWLGTRRQNLLRSLNPLQFSLDCNIDVQHSLLLFSHCVYNDKIKLMKQRITIFCPVCNHKVQSSQGKMENKAYECHNCGTKIIASLLEDYIEITFELTQSPTKAVEVNEPVETYQGNAPGLRMSDLGQYAAEDDSIRRLYNCY